MRFNKFRIFPRILFALTLLGIVPVVLLSLILVFAKSISLDQFKQTLSIFLIVLPVASLCTASILAISIKKTLNTLLFALHQFRLGHFNNRIKLNGDPDSIRLFRGFNMMSELLDDSYKQIMQHEKNEALLRQAQQVAHDIRSPLAALNVAITDLNDVEESRRILIRQAVQRIEDITNDLASKKSKAGNTENSDEGKTLRPQLVSGILDLIVSEKRMQFRSQDGIQITAHIPSSTYGLFANLHENTFKRVFSNLINNAVEALGTAGMVEVHLKNEGDSVLIQLIDNGKGIAPDILPKLMQRGETHGKQAGSGLGLFHARETIESWHGRIEVLSELGKGTEIRITLPKVTAPDWFLPELRLGKSTRVIIIDDDSSIHQIWTGRFAATNSHQIQLVHFHSAKAVLQKFTEDPESFAGDVVILCDLELREDQITGLQLMKQIKTTSKTILVTSRFEESHVREECRQLGIKMIPKNLAGFVPIIFAEKNASAATIVLIDDDEMIHKTWQLMAKVKNIKLLSFKSTDEFLMTCDSLDRKTTIYIDSNLGNGERGEERAKDIHAKGFLSIFLATGANKDDFAPMSWITAIVDKKPPF